jgi:hypothetical protein
VTNINPAEMRRAMHEVVNIFAQEIYPILPWLDQQVFPLAVQRLHNGIDRMGNEVVLRRIAIRLAAAAKKDQWFCEMLKKELGL